MKEYFVFQMGEGVVVVVTGLYTCIQLHQTIHLKDLYISLYGKFTSFLRVKEKTGGMYSVSKANGQKRLYDNFHKDSGQ